MRQSAIAIACYILLVQLAFCDSKNRTGLTEVGAGQSISSIPYSPNLLFISDSTEYFQCESIIKSKGGKIRVAGVIRAGKYESKDKFFAFVLMPENLKRMTSLAGATVVYADDARTQKCATDPLINALIEMNDPIPILADSVPTEKEGREYSRHSINRATSRGIDGNEGVSIQREGNDYESNQYKKNICRHFDRAITLVHLFVDGSKSLNNHPELNWSQTDYVYAVDQAVFGLNHLSWLCETKAFPVTFYAVFRFVEIETEPLYQPSFVWYGQVNQALGYPAEYPGAYDLTWHEMAVFGTPQAAIMYKMNEGEGTEYTNWANMWDNTLMVGGLSCITGRYAMGYGLQYQWKIDIHEWLHCFGAVDERADEGTACSSSRCNDTYGIYSHHNTNCEACGGNDPCIMRKSITGAGFLCQHTAWHIGLIDTNDDNGPDPVQLCTHTCFVQHQNMRLGDIIELWTVDNYYVNAFVVSRWNSFELNGLRKVIIPDLNQWRNFVAIDNQYYAVIHHPVGSTESAITVGAWQSPDHVQGAVGEVEFVDSTLRFQFSNVANLDIHVLRSSTDTVATPAAGQLFAGTGDWKAITMDQMLPDGSYAVIFRGYGIDGTGPIQRTATRNISNGAPNPPGLKLTRLNLQEKIVSFELKDNRVTQYYRIVDGSTPIDSISPAITSYSLAYKGGSKYYGVAAKAGNINGETQSDSIIAFLSLPNTVNNLSGEVVYIQKTLPVLHDRFAAGEMPDSVPTNAVELHWSIPQWQYAAITQIRICHGRYEHASNHEEFVRDTIVLPPTSRSFKIENLRPFISHVFSITTRDVYGQESYHTPYISIDVGGPSQFWNDTIPSTSIPKSGSSADQAAFAIYPNPFNPITAITYSLPRDSRVIISVYNILGQEVAMLIDGFQSAGTHHTKWMPSQETPGGIYLVRFSLNGVTKTIKAVFLK